MISFIFLIFFATVFWYWFILIFRAYHKSGVYNHMIENSDKDFVLYLQKWYSWEYKFYEINFELMYDHEKVKALVQNHYEKLPEELYKAQEILVALQVIQYNHNDHKEAFIAYGDKDDDDVTMFKLDDYVNTYEKEINKERAYHEIRNSPEFKEYMEICNKISEEDYLDED